MRPGQTRQLASRIARTVAMLACLAIAAAPTWALAQTPATATDSPPAVEVPDTLQPKRRRTEAESDRIAAAAWYTKGRLLRNRGEKANALWAYQRAWRYDPQPATILSDIIPLALELRRGGEAARYAVLVDAAPEDPVLLRRLALQLTEQRQWQHAVKLYEQSLAAEPEVKGVSDLSSAVLQQEMGRLYFLSDQYDKAASAFAKVRDAIASTPPLLDEQAQGIVLGSDPADTYSLWAESFLAAKRFDEALSLFERSHAIKANAGRLAMHKARVEAARDRHSEALDLLNEFFQSQEPTESLEPFTLLASLVEKQSADKEAASNALFERLKTIREKRPDDELLVRFYAERLIQADRLDEAAQLLDAGKDGKQTSSEFDLLVRLFQRQKKYDQLLETLGEVAGTTGSLRVVSSEVETLLADDGGLNELVERAKKLPAEGADKAQSNQLLAAAMLALEAKRWDDAEALFKAHAATESDSKAGALVFWGLGLLLADQHERAIPVLQQVLDKKLIAANEASLRMSLAAALELSGRTDEAVAEAKKSLEGDSRSLSLRTRFGWLLYHAKRYAEAEAAYREFLAKADSRHDSAEVRDAVRSARLALSNVALAQDKFDEAVEWLEQVLDEYPDDAGALNDLGYLWAERGVHLERALAMAQRAVEAEPDNPAYRDSLGWAYYQLGRYGEAVKELEAAVAGDDPSGVVLEHLGDAYAKIGEATEARSLWDRALKAFQDEQETKKLEALRQKMAATGE